MFRSVVRFFPAFGNRFASTMVARPSSPILSQFSLLKQNVQFITPGTKEPLNIGLNIIKNEPLIEESSTISEMIMTSVLRKRRLKMKKHKLRKRRKAQRALRIKIGK